MIHPQAIVDSEWIGTETNIWAYAHVLAGARIGNNVNVADHAFIEGGAVIGNNVTLKNHVCVWDGVTIEDDVFVGPNVTFSNDKHPRSPRMEAAKQRYKSPSVWLSKTRVRRGCSIGASATILPGIELGAYSMIAAGSVVTRDVSPFALVIGAPAKRHADVCTCGQVLDGDYATSTCSHCGQTGAVRVQLVEPATSSDC